MIPVGRVAVLPRGAVLTDRVGSYNGVGWTTGSVDPAGQLDGAIPNVRPIALAMLPISVSTTVLSHSSSPSSSKKIPRVKSSLPVRRV